MLILVLRMVDRLVCSWWFFLLILFAWYLLYLTEGINWILVLASIRWRWCWLRWGMHRCIYTDQRLKIDSDRILLVLRMIFWISHKTLFNHYLRRIYLLLLLEIIFFNYCSVSKFTTEGHILHRRLVFLLFQFQILLLLLHLLFTVNININNRL